MSTKNVILFCASAALPFAALQATSASASVVRTVEKTACVQSPAPWQVTSPPDPGSPYQWECPLPVGSLNPTSSVLGVYFDWGQHVGASQVALYLHRESYTGTVTTDVTAYTTSDSDDQDVFLAANNIRVNSSPYDYLTAMIQTDNPQNSPNFVSLRGVALVSSQ